MDDEGADNDPIFDGRLRLAQLRTLHEGMSAEVLALQDDPRPDQMQLARLKKQKLLLKDKISRLESSLTPDLIA